MESTGEKPVQALVVREVGPSEIGEFLTAAPPPEAAAAPVTPAAGMMTPATGFKKKRGRPRKYDRQGPGRVTLSPMPISASIPLSGDYSGWNHSQGRESEPIKKKQKVVFNSTDQPLSYTAGSCFTPHLLTVNAGEDVSQKIMSFSQQGSNAICILCATGSISNVTLRQTNSSGGTLTHESLNNAPGWFDLISLNGSFIVNESGGTKSRAGGMSVTLVAPDGRIIAGGLAGLLVAASPVQVVVGTFLHGHQQDQEREAKVKRTRAEAESVPSTLFTSYPTKYPTNITFGSGFERSYNDHNLNFNNPENATNNGSVSKEVNPTPYEVTC